MNECTKAAQRRQQDPSFADTYFVGRGIDIGAGPDGLGKLTSTFPRMESVREWDVQDGDAMMMAGVEDNTFDFAHSSHCLEHVVNPGAALHNWLRIVKPGGYVVVTVPDEDMYEQGVFPSTFNPDHKNTFTPWKPKSWSPVSVSILTMLTTLEPPPEVVKIERLTRDYDWTGPRRDLTALTTTVESAIEIILRKRTEAELAAGGMLRTDSEVAA